MLRPILTAILLGLLAGITTSVVLALMHFVENLIWQDDASAMRIFVTIMLGGVLVAMLRIRLPDANFDSQLDDSRSGKDIRPLRASMLAALGIVSVGFGGAIGPEAGVLAVVAELSALVSARVARDVNEARLINQIGAAGALGGLYGSPPGAASYANDQPDAPWPFLLLAAVAGLIGMMLAGMVLPQGPGLQIPLPDAATFSAHHLLPAIAAALAGGLAGVIYVATLLGMGRGLAAMFSDVRVQVLVGTLVYALLAAAFPVLRFNGQHELAHLADAGLTVGAGYLIGISALKAVALALCLAARWLGGPIMPLALAGAAAGSILAALFPAIDLGVAAAAGMAACATVGMNKPLVVLLVLIFMATNTALLPIVIGVVIGWQIAQFLPEKRMH